MKNFKKIAKRVVAATLAVAYSITAAVAPAAWAAESSSFGFLVSPMNQSIVLSPGDTYSGSFKVANPNSSENDLTYVIEQKSFYVDENYDTIYDENDAPIVEWTKITSGATGTISPNNSVDVRFTITVPKDAPAGGQYEAFRVISQPAAAGGDAGLVIQESLVITHLVFAEVIGNTVRQGEIVSTNVPSFLFDGNITGSSSIKNTGNMHSVAKYTLQVFPLFSDEEVYTNEEDPETRTILPDRTYYNEIAWNKTPAMGIFNVLYTVEFEGVTAQVSKLVIKCPLWLLFAIIFIFAAIIIWIITRVRARRK